ncbi:MAG: hypothetical protein PHU75_03890 [Candidatus Nanopelagicales bacterium]|nr:hypothetical protein [Candidatus Nanopelagicales bacterium]
MTPPRSTFSRSRDGGSEYWSLNLSTLQMWVTLLAGIAGLSASMWAGAKTIIIPMVRDEIRFASTEQRSWNEREHMMIRTDAVSAAERVKVESDTRMNEILHRLEYIQQRVDIVADRATGRGGRL